MTAVAQCTLLLALLFEGRSPTYQAKVARGGYWLRGSPAPTYFDRMATCLAVAARARRILSEARPAPSSRSAAAEPSVIIGGSASGPAGRGVVRGASVIAPGPGIVPLAVAHAWSESRFRATAVSSSGARGPLQVVPRYWCPGRRLRGCDLITAGIRALRALLARHHDPVMAICAYTGRGARWCRAGERTVALAMQGGD